MSTLNFPDTRPNGDPLQPGDTYLADTGVTYTYDGVKWIGRSNVTTAIGYTGSAGAGYTGSQGSIGYTGSQGDFGQVDRLINGAKEVVLNASGTLNVPSPTSIPFPLVFSATNYVPTIGKPVLTLTDTPWALNGQYAYAPDGRAALALDNIWPTVINPGYESGDAFTFDSTVHGISGFVLTITLSSVVLAGPAGWTANVSESAPPEYPSTINSLGAIKFTSNSSSLILGTDGDLNLPVNGGVVFDRANTSIRVGMGFHIASGEGIDIQAIDETDPNNLIYKNWYFSPNGTLTLPQPTNVSFNDPSIVFDGATRVATNNYGFSVPGPAAGIVYNATTLNLASMKLLVTIEGQEDGGDGLNHTQVCEMLVVRRSGLTVNTVDSVVYGVVHTSLAPLATLTTQQNVDGRVEILAQPTNTATIYVKVHATEVVRGD